MLDLGAEKSFSKVNGSFLRNHGAWIFLPVKMKVYTSADGTDYQLLGEINEPVPQQQQENERKTFMLAKPSKTRYVKIVAEGIHSCPSWHAGNGGKAWVFTDELSVE